MSDAGESRVRNELLRAYLEDLDAGRAKSDAQYRALFPGFEALVDDELATLRVEGAGEGERFGRYRLLRELGRGGQGAVYLALDESLGRPVALKLLTTHPFAAGESKLRFQREAQVTSRLDDPGICTVHESGEVDGTPFIAMRYVEGETLAQRIAAAREAGAAQVDLPGGGLELVERVARSLHRAHGTGVVHRDVKPGNVMVTPDGASVLLDFGLARAQDEDLPTLTRTGDVFGTPAYMAPEQLAQAAEEVGPAADVYALGATLYECLTLRRPFEAPTREALYRAIAVDEPADPASVRPDLPADLRVILATALAKDPTRRYRSALDLAEDLRRLRAGEPILARPPSLAYRTRRFVGRHRSLVTATLVLVVGLAVATAVTTGAMLRAQDERAAAERTLEVFEEVLGSGTRGSGGRAVRLVDVLDRSAGRVERELETLPRGGARLMTVLGRLYSGLGEHEPADELLSRAWEVLRERDGPDSPAALRARQALGVLRRRQARFAESEEHLTAVRDALARAVGPRDARTLQVTLELAVLWIYTNDFPRAEEALAAAREHATGELATHALAELARLRQEQGREDEALALLEEVARRTEEESGPGHPDCALSWNALASQYHTIGRLEDAEALYRRALDLQRRVLGPAAPETLVTASNLGFLLKDQGRLAEAEELLSETLAAKEAVLDPNHPSLLSTLNNLGRLYQALRRLEDAEDLLRRAAEGASRSLGDRHRESLMYRNNLGLVLQDMGRLDEAEDELTAVLEARERELGPDDRDTLYSLNNLGWLLAQRGRPEEAEELFARSLAGRREHLGDDDPATHNALLTMALFLERRGRLDEALELARELLTLAPQGHPARAGAEALVIRAGGAGDD